MLALLLPSSRETQHELGSLLPEVLISLGILASCAAMTFSYLVRTARTLDSLEQTHRARFETTSCSSQQTYVSCQIGTTSVTIAR
jgi:hypothetical protein